jgi:hypothetical protein
VGEIRGWTAQIHLFGYGTDARLAPLIQRYAPRVGAIVVAEPVGAAPSDNVRALASTVALGGIHTPTAIFSSDALGRQWNSLTDRTPVHVADAAEANAGSALKALVRTALSTFRRPESVRPPA